MNSRMCELCANKITISKEILKKEEEILDVRGKKFMKQVKRLSKLFEKYFLNIAEEGIQELDKNIFIQKIEDDRFDDRKEDFNAELEKTYKIGAKFQESEVQKQITIGVYIGISDDKAKAYAQERIGEFISKIDDETRQEIKGIINDGFEKQLSAKEVAGNITTQFTQFSDRRATLIANTEASLAYTYGQKEHFEGYLSEFGTPGRKRTQTQGDEKVRDSHREAEKLGWIPYKQEYLDSDGQMQISNLYAPFGFNCRCVTSFSLFNPDTNSVW